MIRLTPLAALVRGCPSWDVTTIDADLACDDKRMVQYRWVLMCVVVAAVVWWLQSMLCMWYFERCVAWP